MDNQDPYNGIAQNANTIQKTEQRPCKIKNKQAKPKQYTEFKVIVFFLYL